MMIYRILIVLSLLITTAAVAHVPPLTAGHFPMLTSLDRYPARQLALYRLYEAQAQRYSVNWPDAQYKAWLEGLYAAYTPPSIQKDPNRGRATAMEEHQAWVYEWSRAIHTSDSDTVRDMISQQIVGD